MAPRLLFVLAVVAFATQGELVIVKEGTGLYHRPGCEVIRDASDILAMNTGQANARGYKPHDACDPSKQPPASAPGEPARPAGKPGAKTPARIDVWIDGRGTLYHREGCRRLSANRRKVVLDPALVKKHWPCGVCKPPILPRKNKNPWSA